MGAVVLRPLPFDKPEELVHHRRHLRSGIPRFDVYPNYRDWRDRSKTLAAYGGFAGWNFRLSTAGEPRILDGAAVYGDVFGVLRIRPAMGRAFQSQAVLRED